MKGNWIVRGLVCAMMATFTGAAAGCGPKVYALMKTDFAASTEQELIDRGRYLERHGVQETQGGHGHHD